MLSERRSALLANQEKWKEKVSPEKVNDISVAKLSSLEARKRALLQASNDWKGRVKHDNSINNFDSTYKLKNEIFATPNFKKRFDDQYGSKSVPKQMKLSKNSIVSELIKKTTIIKPKYDDSPDKMDLEFEESSPKITPITRRPTMPKTRRLPSSLASLHVDTSNSSTPILTTTAMKRSPDSDKENEGRAPKECLSEERKKKILLSSPKRMNEIQQERTPILGLKNCGIQLKKPDIKRPYPDIMLIRCKGGKMVDVRCVSPKITSIHECATFVLITSTRLMIYEGEYSSLIEKTKAKQIAHSVISMKDLSCLATKIDLVKDDKRVENDFYKELKKELNSSGDVYNEIEKIPKDLLKYIDPDNVELFEDEIKQINQIYEITEGEATLILKNEIPYSSILNSNKILIFDFGSEIYIWIGHDADRTLIKFATEFTEELKKNIIGDTKLLFSEEFISERPDWIVIRKLTEGLPDCLFRLKFVDPLPIPSPKTPRTPKFSTPRFVMASSKLKPKTPIDLCGLEERLKDDNELTDQLAMKLFNEELKEYVLELEETELIAENENIFTEGLKVFKLVNEVLEEQNETFFEFFDIDCYIIKWLYRVEKSGIKKLNGTPCLQKDTGRQRTAYFYWFGKNITKKTKGACALALRKFDKDRREHVLIEQGNELPLFLHLFNGELIFSSNNKKDDEKHVYIIHGSKNNYFYAEEVDNNDDEDIKLRSQGIYLIIDKKLKQISMWKGKHVNNELIKGATKIAKKFNEIYGYNISDDCNNLKYSIIEPLNWIKAPKMYRLYDKEGELMSSIQYHKLLNFTYKQNDLKGTIIIDQETCLWIWTDVLISTFYLETAYKYWKLKNNNNKQAKIIYKSKEPDEFKALFPIWINYNENDLNLNDFIPENPKDLNKLLHERTKPRTLDEVRQRKLPVGCDTKNLEKFLTDNDFEKVFKMKRNEFYVLPKWKQTLLKKDAKLF